MRGQTDRQTNRVIERWTCTDLVLVLGRVVRLEVAPVDGGVAHGSVVRAGVDLGAHAAPTRRRQRTIVVVRNL